MKMLALLMLSSLIADGLTMHTCGRPVPENCQNNPNIRLQKNGQHYRLSLCMNKPDCLPGSAQEWFECNEVCEVCRSLPGSPSCANNNACEEQVDAYLNSYCQSIRPTTITVGPTVTVTTTQASMTIIQTVTVTTVRTQTVTNAVQTVTSTVYSTCPPSVQCNNLPGTNSTAFSSPPSTSQKSTLVLGALLALCVVALLIVITGWIWTCSVLNKKDRTNSNSGMLKFDVNKFFKNPTYESADIPSKLSPTQPEESNALTPEQQKFQKNKYDRIVVVPSQTGNKQKYDVLSRQHTFTGADPTASIGTASSETSQEGHTVESQVSASVTQQVSAGGTQYSQLGCRDKEVENYCITRLVE